MERTAASWKDRTAFVADIPPGHGPRPTTAPPKWRKGTVNWVAFSPSYRPVGEGRGGVETAGEARRDETIR